MLLFDPKAERDLREIQRKRPSDFQYILAELEKHLNKSSIAVNGNKIKLLQGIIPSLYRLRINASISHRAFFRIFSDRAIVLRVVAKKDTDRILKDF